MSEGNRNNKYLYLFLNKKGIKDKFHNIKEKSGGML